MPAIIYGQSIGIHIKISDVNHTPIPYASVSLKGVTDTSFKIGTITDSAAMANFSLNKLGSYNLNVTAVGFKNYQKIIKVTDSNFSWNAVLVSDAASLNEVVVQASRPLMQMDDDKTIINVESLEAASTNAYEILEKTPGLFVDQDGNVYIASTTPATIYINGRELKMSAADIANMLKSLPPNSIDRIEILRTPSAKYDASSSGGIVNIILKKGVKIGLNGSFNGAYQQGKYSNKIAGLSLSNSDGATSLYLNTNYANNNNYQQLNTNRYITPDTILAQKAYTTYPNNVLFLGFGLRHDFSKKWNISYDARLNYNSGNNNTNNLNSFVVASNQNTLGNSTALSHTNDKTFNLNQEFSANYKIDSLGSEWTTNLTYTYYKNKETLNYDTYSILPYGGNGNSDAVHQFFALQSDLTYKFPHKITFESGIKSTYLPFNNNSDYVIISDGTTSPDNARTSTYQYRENINSAYAQASKTIGSVIFKAGVRMENTNMTGHQFIPSDTSFSIHRTDFFPYLYLSRKVMSIAKYELRAYLVYRKTIARPSYDQLNPFPKYEDQFLSDVGNPNLKPQFTNNYEANISVESRPLLAVGFNDTRDMFTNVFYRSDSISAVSYKTFDNIGHNKEFYLRGMGIIPPGGVYFFVLGGQFNHNIYNGAYQGQPLYYSGDSWLFFTYQQLKIDKNSMLTLNGFLRLKGNLQFYELSSFGSLSLNINRKFFNQKMTVTLSLSDAFFTNNNDFSINQPTVNAYGYRETDTRRVGINFRYNFGLRKKEEEQDMFKMPQQ
jgi:hypothetical protein